MPSTIDLDLAIGEVVDEAGGVTSGREGRSAGAAAVKRWYSPSGYAQEKAMVFEASEGGALQDGMVKHYDADCMYLWQCLSRLCSLTGSPSSWLFQH